MHYYVRRNNNLTELLFHRTVNVCLSSITFTHSTAKVRFNISIDFVRRLLLKVYTHNGLNILPAHLLPHADTDNLRALLAAEYWRNRIMHCQTPDTNVKGSQTFQVVQHIVRTASRPLPRMEYKYFFIPDTAPYTLKYVRRSFVVF